MASVRQPVKAAPRYSSMPGTAMGEGVRIAARWSREARTRLS
jgi:hypothetical protein